jgi:hypothetical protein
LSRTGACPTWAATTPPPVCTSSTDQFNGVSVQRMFRKVACSACWPSIPA